MTPDDRVPDRLDRIEAQLRELASLVGRIERESAAQFAPSSEVERLDLAFAEVSQKAPASEVRRLDQAYEKIYGLERAVSRLLRSPGIPYRFLVISTPRSGNTWMRVLLGRLFEAHELAVHHPDNIPWRTIPTRLVVQLHWEPTSDLLDKARAAGMIPVTMVRHPLDVLVSVLRFSPRDGDTGLWLEGREGNEKVLEGATPTSDAFLEYATSPRASRLLGVTPRWLDAGTTPVRYEDLVADATSTLQALLKQVDREPLASIGEAVEASSLHELRRRNPEAAYHFWQGRAGLWRTVLTAEAVERIADAHSGVFQQLDYCAEPDPSLTTERAEANWRALTA